MRKQKNKILIFILTLIATFSYSQEEEQDTLKTDVIQVVKPYTPTISDAFKVKEVPMLDDAITNTKKAVTYNIFSFPVASTFTPAKGKAAVVDKEEELKLYDNYASLGFGNYTTVLGEVYLNHAISRTESVGAYLSHHSSQGGIQDIYLDDNFSNSKINANYSRSERDLTWNVNAGFQHQKYNWYGLPLSIYNANSAANIADVGHSYANVDLGGDFQLTDAFVKSGSVLFRRFGDNNNSGENRLIAKTNGNITIQDLDFNVALKLDYLGGKFERNYYNSNPINYGNFNIGFTPSYQFIKEDLTLDLGVSLYYLYDSEFNKSKFYWYPNVQATYRLVDEILIAYGGLQGDLIQNTYYGFAQENAYVSPTLWITPTDQKLNTFVGLKGKISSTMSYDISGKFIGEKNKALFKNNPITAGGKTYMHGNSFAIVYDNVTTLGLSGAIYADINRNFTLGAKLEYFSYGLDNQEEAWNLPDLKGNLFLDYQINKQWFAGANVFFVGKRKDQIYNTNLPLATPATVNLGAYLDANANVGYHINDRFSVYGSVNNIANQKYESWQNYQVQGIQFLGGATYKFDF